MKRRNVFYPSTVVNKIKTDNQQRREVNNNRKSAEKKILYVSMLNGLSIRNVFYLLFNN
jgi:hypothetical protein